MDELDKEMCTTGQDVWMGQFPIGGKPVTCIGRESRPGVQAPRPPPGCSQVFPHVQSRTLALIDGQQISLLGTPEGLN